MNIQKSGDCKIQKFVGYSRNFTFCDCRLIFSCHIPIIARVRMKIEDTKCAGSVLYFSYLREAYAFTSALWVYVPGKKNSGEERNEDGRSRVNKSREGENRMDIKEAEEYLNGIPKFSKKTTMDNERRILALLGHPEEGQRFVHVAGTNGKGSVCAFLSRILLEQGHHVGTFVSPHLVDITERFLIDGEQASEEEFLAAFRRVYDLCREREEIVHPSYFEFLFLIGMLIFKERQVDVTVLEVGLGGRLDATNVIEDPLVCVIASISLDHTEILGETIPEIAGEKAGIIKEGCPVVYDDSVPEASAVIRAQAAALGAPAWPVNPADFEIAERGRSGICFRVREGALAGEELRVPFVADYQAMNASLAVTAAGILRQKLPLPRTDRLQPGTAWAAGVRQALLRTSWPGRMEPVLPGMYMDGAHNDDGIRVFLETVTRLPCAGKKYLLFSAVVEKDYETMIDEICRPAGFDGFILTELDSYRALPLADIRGAFERRTDRPVWCFGEIGEAFAFAREKKGEDDLLFIAGSLYLAGSIKELLMHTNVSVGGNGLQQTIGR